jgi:hypothetical protein
MRRETPMRARGTEHVATTMQIQEYAAGSVLDMRRFNPKCWNAAEAMPRECCSRRCGDAEGVEESAGHPQRASVHRRSISQHPRCQRQQPPKPNAPRAWNGRIDGTVHPNTLINIAVRASAYRSDEPCVHESEAKCSAHHPSRMTGRCGGSEIIPRHRGHVITLRLQFDCPWPSSLLRVLV